jgi:hypothetical protein
MPQNFDTPRTAWIKVLALILKEREMDRLHRRREPSAASNKINAWISPINQLAPRHRSVSPAGNDVLC